MPRLALVLLALLLVAVLVGLATMGSHRLPQPIGPAGNGLLVIDAGYRITEQSTDGSSIRTLTTPTELAAMPSFSLDGTRIAFFSWPVRTGLDPSLGSGPPLYDAVGQPIASLVVMNADGTGRRVAASNIRLMAGVTAAPAWSHDGTHLAYTHGDVQRQSVIDVIGLDGTQVLSVLGQFPDWSPGDSLLAYTLQEAGGQANGAHVVSIADPKADQLVSHRAADDNGCDGATWSPDGQKLAYHCGPFDQHVVYIVDAKGQRERAITAPPTDALWPIWSPDGSKLAYETVRDLTDGIRFTVTDVNGSNARDLSTPILTWVPGTWSPDGRYIIGHTGTPDAKLGDLLLIDVADPSRSQLVATDNRGAAFQRVAP